VTILGYSPLNADVIGEVLGHRKAPECPFRDCEFRTAAGLCAIPRCKVDYPGHDINAWALGAVAVRLTAGRGTSQTVAARLKTPVEVMRAGVRTYNAIGCDWTLSDPEPPSDFIAWSPGYEHMGICDRCGGTLLNRHDVVVCSMCSRSPKAGGEKAVRA
jgi:hypothetical protein